MQQGWGSVCEVYKWLLRHDGSGYYQVGRTHKGAKSPRAAMQQEAPKPWRFPTCNQDGKLSRGKAGGVISGEEGCAGLAVVNADWVKFLLHDCKGAAIVVSSRTGHKSIFSPALL